MRASGRRWCHHPSAPSTAADSYSAPTVPSASTTATVPPVHLRSRRPHRVSPGATLMVGRFVQHYVENDGKVPLKMFWAIMPSGLEDWFKALGRPGSVFGYG